MSGHSKWHNIKRQKGAKDAQRSKLFSKVSRLLMVAAKHGGGDADANPSLRLAIQKAKEARMPKDNMEKAIKKGVGDIGGGDFHEVTYEAFGPYGGALIIECLTDNINRTVSEIRNILNKAGGNMGTKGSASYMFDRDTKTPIYKTDLETEDQVERVFSFLDSFDDNEDVQAVYHNYDLPEEEDEDL